MSSTPLDDVGTTESGPSGPRPVLLRTNQVFGDYRIVRLLGRGGMGEVYEADDMASGRRVALKVVNVARSSPIALQRFLREGQLAAALSHPNTVYVFESGETDGVPYIVTEFVADGTLADRVKASGPLPVSQAVDMILDVIAGLAAASDLGILHRDVKPSNCFVTSDGRVKLGDFGVSIPLDAKDRTELTLTGLVIGTPTYCAPEQLKGETLDARSDIYSVGATLYFLLVGQPPLRGTDVVHVIEQVLVATPEPARRQRPEIPKHLSDLVASCLAKKREQRPPTYAALAAALKPFSSAQLTPAPLAPRALAALLDAALLIVMWNAMGGLWLQVSLMWRGVAEALAPLSRPAVTVAYFAFCEYWWGASLGKRLCGLTVATAYGSPIAFWPAVVRASIVFAALSVPTPITVPPLGRVILLSPGPLGLVAALLLFVTARRSNGYAGIHELLTASRTWEASGRRVQTEVAAAAPSAIQVLPESIGPYRIEQRIDQRPALVLGRDERLKRSVWLRLGSPEDAPVSPERRDLQRPLRFRWLGGTRGPLGNWDAFEYAQGRPFEHLEVGRLAFQTLARWLTGLARECQAAGLDGTLSSVALNRLWMTRSGDVKITDWPLAEVAAGDEYRTGDVRSCQAFLSVVAATAMARVPGLAPPPRYGHALMERIAEGRFTDFDDLVAACESAAERDSTLSMDRRLAPIIAVSAVASIPLVVALVMIPSQMVLQLRLMQRVQLGVCMRELRGVIDGSVEDPTGAKRQAAEMCVGAMGRAVGAFDVDDFRVKNPDSAALLDAALAKYPDVSIAQLEARRLDMPPAFDLERLRPESTTRIRWNQALDVFRMLAFLPIRGLALFGAVCIVSALLLKDGLLYRALGIAIVHPDGSDASRWRAMARAAVTWMPMITGALMARTLYSNGRFIVAWLPAVVMVSAAVYAARHPARGIPERLTGTYLVRR